VNDNIPPALVGCPSNITVQCAADVLPPANVTATDNCGPVTPVFVEIPLTGGSCGGTITRTWTATDACQNTASCTQVITVNDTQIPEIACPVADTIPCNGDVPPPATDLAGFIALGGSASDNCGDVTVIWVSDVSDSMECPETITRTYSAIDFCENTAECTQIFTVECCPREFCTLTKGAYGSEGGNDLGMTTIDLIESMLATPLIIGVQGVRSVTFRFEDAQCIIDRLPGGSTPTTLPQGLGSVEMNDATCQTSPALPLKKNGQFENNFLAQLITLSLNARAVGNEAGLELCPWMVAHGTIHISDSVFSALTTLGLPHTVNGLIELANRAIAGMPTAGATLAEIHSAVSGINEGFDECATLTYCSDVPPLIVGGRGATAAKVATSLPTDYALEQNYPNPFNAGTVIPFSLRNASDWTLTVYNVMGQVVRNFAGTNEAGQTQVIWNGSDANGASVASGVYFYRVQAGAWSATKKMALVK
jgi:hypothetical protein